MAASSSPDITAGFAALIADVSAERDRAQANGQVAIVAALDQWLRRARDLEASGGSPDDIKAYRALPFAVGRLVPLEHK